jgi:hypothetical protein
MGQSLPFRLYLFALVMPTEVKTGASEVDVVFGDLVAQETAGRSVVVEGHRKPSSEISQA